MSPRMRHGGEGQRGPLKSTGSNPPAPTSCFGQAGRGRCPGPGSAGFPGAGTWVQGPAQSKASVRAQAEHHGKDTPRDLAQLLAKPEQNTTLCSSPSCSGRGLRLQPFPQSLSEITYRLPPSKVIYSLLTTEIIQRSKRRVNG